MKQPARFIWLWFGSLLVLAGIVAGINLLVDPYEVFGTPRIAGISLLKPAAKNHSMLAKTYQIARFHPVTVLIGSSSTHIGVDAADAAWPDAMKPVYNYGIPGGYATSTSIWTLQEAIALGGVKNAIVFLDFENFFRPEEPETAMTEDDRRYHLLQDGQPNPNRAGQVARDMFLSLGTMGALVDSIQTVLGQRTPNLLNLAANGSSTESDFSNAARIDGMHDLFAQKDSFETDKAPELSRIMANWNGALPNIEIVSRIIAVALAHDVKLTLVITPHHADVMELYWRNGLWPRVEQEKAELADLVATQGKGKVALWDFMEYSGFTTEAVPRAGDHHTALNWFWEPTHFKKQLGHIMIERILHQPAPNFGVELTPQTVQARNEEVRAERQAIVCDGNTAFLTVLDKPLDSGCTERLAKAHGPS